MIAMIAVDAATFAIDKPYSYSVPKGMQISCGMRVQVPFGKGNRQTEGVVVELKCDDDSSLKDIERCLDDVPVLSEKMLKLASFMRERYFCTFYDAIRAMLPAGLWFQIKETYHLTDDRSWENKNLKIPFAETILLVLKDGGGTVDGKILRTVANDDESWERAISYLLKKKWIHTDVDYLRRLGDKTEKIASLAVPSQEAISYAESRTKAAAMQKAVLMLLCSVGEISVKELCYFTGAKPATVKNLAEKGYIKLTHKEALRCREITPLKVDGPLELNDEQTNAYEGLLQLMHSHKPQYALLHGVTGSGKTAVYIRLIRSCLDNGKQAMLLVPEIALTPQLLGLMAAYFGKQVAVLHSSLPATERYDQWKRIRDGEATVVIGTRSAIFAPCGNLGLLILDEEQEHSYKSENNPRYDAREIAMWRGAKENALVIFGSATPSVQTMYHTKSGVYHYFRLSNRYNGKPLPKVDIVDIRKEIELGNETSVSYTLQDAIGENRNAGKQTVLFLNRRGNSRSLVCIDCCEAPECPRCSARLTYHSVNERLMCHYCGHSERVVAKCTRCGGSLKRIGTGTQRVQEELKAVFPDMQVLRMDADTVSATNTHEMILNRFRDEKIPVLLGTQMVAKGLNFPDVTLVGVLDADMSLYTDSYLAAENTFNMLTQVVGRAGRGDEPGRAMIQTATPEHTVIKLAAVQDYDRFYDMEIELRKCQKYPPFGDLLTIVFTGQDEGRVLRGASKFRESLNACLKLPDYSYAECTVLGPAPCPVPKINYNFRYRITLRCRLDRELRQLLAHMLRQFAKDRENRGVSAFADVNGLD